MPSSLNLIYLRVHNIIMYDPRMKRLKNPSVFIRHPFLSGIPFIAFALVILIVLPAKYIFALLFIGMAVFIMLYSYSENKDLKNNQRMRMKPHTSSKPQAQNNEPEKVQEASLPGEHKPPAIQEHTVKEIHREPEIRPVIDTSDKTKTTLTITYGIKKYLDQNKLDNETFSDELVRLLSRK